jgi:hypothetical protein
MARRSVPLQSQDKALTATEMRSGMERLGKRIQELRDLDPNSISDYRSGPIVGLGTRIEDTLAAIFGHGTPKFKRYRTATDLEPALVPKMTSDWITARGGYVEPGIDIGELREGINQRKERSIAVLEQAVRGLEEELPSADHSVIGEEFEPPSTTVQPKNAVFVVHGHDEAALQAVARFLEHLGLPAIILREQPDSGRTIIEKFEDYADQVGFAVVLLTPDDIAGTAGAAGSATRARQNVIFELGYFSGKLGRGRACLLRKGDVEIPSDLYGVIYKDFDPGEGWKLQLVKELKAAQLDFDANRMWS